MGSFWGTPTCQPKDKDVAKLIEYLREMTRRQDRARTLQVATSAMRAISLHVAQVHGPREALAIADMVASEIKGLA